MYESELSLRELTCEIVRLRRQQRMLKVVLVVITAAVAGTYLFRAPVSAAPPVQRRIIEADEFVVKDATGAVRATLGWNEESVSLWLYDNKGNARVASYVSSQTPVYYPDTADEHRAQMKTFLANGNQWCGTSLLDIGGKGVVTQNAMPWGGEVIVRTGPTETIRLPKR